MIWLRKVGVWVELDDDDKPVVRFPAGFSVPDEKLGRLASLLKEHRAAVLEVFGWWAMGDTGPDHGGDCSMCQKFFWTDEMVYIGGVCGDKDHCLFLRGGEAMLDKGKCRSCGAVVLWGETAATGKRMPLDAMPRGDGNLAIGADGKIIAAKDAPDGAVRYVSHFMTCRDSQKWRKS